jgi:putative ABC transport system ATP-binding protein
MKELNEKEGVAFLFSTHDQRLINEVKRVVRIDDGRILSNEKRSPRRR